MHMNLSKSEKKIARIIIEKGLEKEFASGMELFYEILSDWKINHSDNKESYYKIYESVKQFDKQIARRYDNMKGSDYIFVIAAQFAEGIITENDLQEFSEETKQKIKLLSTNE